MDREVGEKAGMCMGDYQGRWAGKKADLSKSNEGRQAGNWVERTS